MDMWLIPWLSLLYLLSFLDRTNIGNARVAKMEPDLKMGGRDYNNALTIFFISYAGFEPLTNIAIKKWSPRVFFTAIILAWGIIMTLMGVVHNKAGLLACRWFLGIAEAGLFPGVNYYLSYDFPPPIIGTRHANNDAAAGTSVKNSDSVLLSSSPLPHLQARLVVSWRRPLLRCMALLATRDGDGFVSTAYNMFSYSISADDYSHH